jgi:hypothetical protein
MFTASPAARVGLLVATSVVLAAGAARAQEPMRIYGYFSTRLEKTFSEPTWNGSEIVDQSAPREISLPFANIMLQQQLGSRFSAFVNLNASGGGTVDVRNMWGEMVASKHLSFRFGKMYRRFGLYNEVLDAVPTYYGIEPPEAFDSDHLMISRTTLLTANASVALGPTRLSLALSTDNGEGDGLLSEGTLPLATDVNYVFGRGAYTVGVSGYRSGGAATPDVGLGDGPPRSGVLPWMADDSFTLWNAYAQAKVSNFTFQLEYASANHNARREPDAVVSLLGSTGVNAAQLARFLIDTTAAVDAGNVRVSADYKVRTWYARAGYAFETGFGEVGPYLQWDWYSNPETIAEKTYGGDNEAGVADDGVFRKGTLGVVFRPIPAVAVKLDGSMHFYRFHGERVSYPELRFDVSYTFGL